MCPLQSRIHKFSNTKAIIQRLLEGMLWTEEKEKPSQEDCRAERVYAMRRFV